MVLQLPGDEPAAQTQGLQAHAMQGKQAIVNDVLGGHANLGPRPRSEHAIVFSRWPCELLHTSGVSGVSKADGHGGAPICKVHFGTLKGIDYICTLFLFTKVCLVCFTNDGI